MNRNKEDLNPMDGLANLADAMLVFACGLLVALIVNWNVDVGAERKPQEIADGGAGETEIVLDESNLQEMGKVYK
ncbi:MAG: DUF2149 domain-containing protein, partial [Anaerovoracaceae bacterium]